MIIEDLDLPYEYTSNTRAGSMAYVWLSVLLSVILALAAYFGPVGHVTIPWWVALIPVGLVAHRSYTYSIYLNATHEALRSNEYDKTLDKFIELHMNSLQPQKSPALNGQTFAQKLAADVRN